MPTLKVNVVDDDDVPVSGKKVTVFVFRNLMLDTLLEAATDDKGGAAFKVEENCTVDVHVGENIEYEDLGVGQANEDLTVAFN